MALLSNLSLSLLRENPKGTSVGHKHGAFLDLLLERSLLRFFLGREMELLAPTEEERCLYSMATQNPLDNDNNMKLMDGSESMYFSASRDQIRSSTTTFVLFAISFTWVH